MHKIEEIMVVGRTGDVVIGCACGWVHKQTDWGRSCDKRKEARAAYREHKAQNKLATNRKRI